MNCLHCFRIRDVTGTKKVCENKHICGITTSLEFNQYIKSGKMPYIIYAGMESLVKKLNGCANNPENSLTVKIGEHIPYG